MPKHLAHRLAIAATTSMLVLFLAATPIGGQVGQPGSAVEAGPGFAAERAALLDALVAKWGPYVQSTFGADVDMWRERLTLQFAKGDETNLREALRRDSFEGAMATLVGRGDRVSDAEISKASAADGLKSSSFADVLGSLGADLTYTPVTPCRVIDTRSTGAGAIAANSTRSFVSINASNYTSQGGSATNCGTLGVSATAVAVNLTAVLPTGPGYATVFPFGTTQPLAASVNYTTGAVVNNTVIAQIPNPLASFDFTIYTAAQSHYVADIVGYLAPNFATALQCQETANTDVIVAAGGTANAVAPACAVGYTQTSTNCESSTWQMPFVFFQSGTCSAQNNSTGTATLRASRTCCRVPGR